MYQYINLILDNAYLKRRDTGIVGIFHDIIQRLSKVNPLQNGNFSIYICFVLICNVFERAMYEKTSKSFIFNERLERMKCSLFIYLIDNQ